MKKPHIIATFFLLIIFNVFFNVFAETIVLESGRVLEADIIDITSKSIKVDLMGAVRNYDLSNIRSIDGEKINTSSKNLSKKIVKTEKSEISKKTEETEEKVNSKTSQTKVEKIQSLLQEKKKELSNKRKEYIQSKKDMKNAARAGFFGFGRSKGETEKLIKAKKKVVRIKKEYIDIKKEINQLRRKLKLAKREAVIKKKKTKQKNTIDQKNKINLEANTNREKAVMYVDIAIKHQFLGEDQEANKNFKKAINQKPDLGQYFFDKGLESYYQDQIWEARKYLNKAKKIFEFNQNYQKINLVDEYISKTLKQ